MKATEEFQDPVDRERTGPVEYPDVFKAPVPKTFQGEIIPNWIRDFHPREQYSWLTTEPAIWGAFEPNWKHVIVMTYKWNGNGTTFGNYTINNGDDPPVSGNHGGPQ